MMNIQQIVSKWLNGILLLSGMMVVGIGPVLDLPTRPPDNPPVTTDPISVPSPSVSGAKIMFQAHSETFDADDWTVVEWQTADGQWVEVDGWQGTFFMKDGAFQVEWWVGSDQLGTGPYRWVVYPNQAKGSVEFVSGAFYLPTSVGQEAVVD